MENKTKAKSLNKSSNFKEIKNTLKINLKNRSFRFMLMWSVISLIFMYFFSFIFITGKVLFLSNLTFSLSVTVLSTSAWFIGREYDKKDPLTGVLSQVIITVFFLFIDPKIEINLLVPLFLILLMKIINIGSTTKFDNVIIILSFITAIFLTVTTGSWVFVFALSVVFFADNWIKGKGDVKWLLGLLSLTVTVIWILWKGSFKYVLDIDAGLQFFFGFVLTLSLLFSLFTKGDISFLASDNSKLSLTKLRYSRIFLFLYFLLVIIFGFNQSYISLLPIFIVILIFPPIRFFNN